MLTLEASDYFDTIIPTCLTILTCVWLLMTYFRLQRKTVGMSMIMVLALSDVIYAITTLAGTLFPQFLLSRIFLILFFYPTYFSIFFASVMSILVYQSLKHKDFEPKKFFIISLVLTFLLSSIFVLTCQISENMSKLLWAIVLFGPPSLSLILTTIFYQLSANVLKGLPHAESQLTKIYIKNLQFYSFAQLLTFGPLFLYRFVLGILDVDEENIDTRLSSCIEALANLSGFINALIFFFQRRSAVKSSKTSFMTSSNGGGGTGGMSMDSELDTTLMNDL